MFSPCGCTFDGKTLDIICDEHTGSEVYGNYDGKMTELEKFFGIELIN